MIGYVHCKSEYDWVKYDIIMHVFKKLMYMPYDGLSFQKSLTQIHPYMRLNSYFQKNEWKSPLQLLSVERVKHHNNVICGSLVPTMWLYYDITVTLIYYDIFAVDKWIVLYLVILNNWYHATYTTIFDKQSTKQSGEPITLLLFSCFKNLIRSPN